MNWNSKKGSLTRQSKQKVKTRTLRLETLESRELLSVNPAEYAQIRDTYDRLALPEDFSSINTVELAELTAEALQAAIDRAAATPQDDLIVVNPEALGQNTLSLENETVRVDYNAWDAGTVSLVSIGDERLQIAVNSAGYSFDFQSGALNFAGLDFVNIADFDLICSINVESVELGIVDSIEQDVRYFDVDGIEIANEALGEQASAVNLAEECFGSSEDVPAVADLQTNYGSQYSENDYAILFVGGYKNSVEDRCFANDVSSLYNVLTGKYLLNPSNIIILYADGYSPSGILPNHSVKSATEANLKNAFYKMNRVMNSDSRLFVYVGDHGGGKLVDSGSTSEEFISASGPSIRAATFRNDLYQIKSGYVTLAFGTCLGGGMLDEIINPATGQAKNYSGNAKFAGGAVANHYQCGWFRSSYPQGYCVWEQTTEWVKKYKFLGFTYKTKTWTEKTVWTEYYSWTKALAVAMETNTSVDGIFSWAEQNYYYSAKRDGERYAPDAGNYRYGNNPVPNAPYSPDPVMSAAISHPWHAGPNFTIFNSASYSNWLTVPSPYVSSTTDKTITVSWAPSTARGNYLYKDLNVNYVVQYRVKDYGDWKFAYVASDDYLPNSCSYTIKNLAGGYSYDICVKAVSTSYNLSSSNSANITATTQKRLAESLFNVVATPSLHQTKLDFSVECDSKSILVTLVDKPSDSSGYVIEWRNMETNVTKSVRLNERAYQYRINGLTDGTRYSVSVKAVGGKSDYNIWGNLFNFRDSYIRTKELYTPKKLIAPNLQMGDNANDLVTSVTPKGEVTWRGGSVNLSQISGYEYRYRALGTNEWHTYSAKGSSFVSPNLPSGYYEFQFRALGNNKKDGSRNATVNSDWCSIYVTQIATRKVVQDLADDPNKELTLRRAFNTLSDGDMIVFDVAGEIVLNSTVTINKSVIIDGSRVMNPDGTPGITINANGLQAFNITSGAANVVLNGVRIINAGGAGVGGAIASLAQNLTVANCVFEDNTAVNAAAIYAEGTSGKNYNVTIKNSVFENNSSVNSGGAVFLRGNGATGAIRIENTEFINNSGNTNSYTDGLPHGGGAIFVDENTPAITIMRSDFCGNISHTSSGGALCAKNMSGITIEDSTFEGNISGDEGRSSGGAIYATAVPLTVHGSQFVDNVAYGNGGAICCTGGGSVNISTGNVFSGNRSVVPSIGGDSGQGGAVYIGTCQAWISDNIFHGNEANVGGGVWFYSSQKEKQIVINDSAFYGNKANRGAAVGFSTGTNNSGLLMEIRFTTMADNVKTDGSLDGSTLYITHASDGNKAALTLENSILVSNAPKGHEIQYINDDVRNNVPISASYALVQDKSNWNCGAGVFEYDSAKPLFADPENGDYSLAPSSQALNRGFDFYKCERYQNYDDAAIDALGDVTGAPRQVGGRADLGPYEYQNYEPRTWTVSSTADSATDEGSIRYILENAHGGDVVLFDESLRGQTITLTNGQLPIRESITIDATNLYDKENGRPGVTVDADHESRIFYIERYAGDVVIRGLTVTNGRTTTEGGGALYKNVDSTLELDRCYFVSNQTTLGDGGAILAFGDTMKIVDSVFKANDALKTRNTSTGEQGSIGGAILADEASVSIVSSKFTQNFSQDILGAILVRGNLDVDRSVFSDNTAVLGTSTIEVVHGDMRISNSTFNNNSGQGTIMLSTSKATRTSTGYIYNSTIVNNEDRQIATVSIWSGNTNQPGVFNIYNSIIALNSVDDGKQYGPYGNAHGNGYGPQTFSLYNTLTSTALGTSGNGVTYRGANNIYYTGGALFTDAENGDYTLSPESLAINAGSNEFVLSETDLAGETRVQAGRVDLGAYERYGRTVVVTSASDDANDEGSLRYVLENARHGDYIIFADSLRGKAITVESPIVITKAVTVDASVFIADGSISDEEEVDASSSELEAAANPYGDGLAILGGDDKSENPSNASRLFTVNAPDQQVVFRNLTFAQGYSRNDGGSPTAPAGGSAIYNMNANVTVVDSLFADNRGSYGGAILNLGSLTLENAEFSNNSAFYGGGAVFNAAGASLTVDGSAFTGNISNADVNPMETNPTLRHTVPGNRVERWAGAIYNANASATINGSTFADNATYSRSSGAIYNSGASAVLTIADSTLTRNVSAQNAGAIENRLGTVTIVGCEISDNRAIGGLDTQTINGASYSIPAGGGAIWNNGGTLTVESSRLTGNSSENYYGGAIYSLDARLTVTDCVISQNTAGASSTGGEIGDYQRAKPSEIDSFEKAYCAGRGGAIFVHSKHSSGYSTATITNTVVEGNSAGYGGGICVQNANVDLYNCDVVNNTSKYKAGGLVVDTYRFTADAAGAAFAPSNVTVHNSIVALNRKTGQTADVDVYVGADESAGNSFANLTADYVLSGLETDFRWKSGSKLHVYDTTLPLFADAAAGDYRLAADSQAIDMGGVNVAKPVDLDGQPRVSHGRVDLGPYEVQNAAPVSLVVTSDGMAVEEPGTLPNILQFARSGDTVTFAPSMKGKTITLDAEIEIGNSITIDASAIWDAENNAPGVTVSGGGRRRIFTIDPLAGDVTITGLKFIDGKPDATNRLGYGGAIYATDVNLTINDCVFENNSAYGIGGAIYAYYDMTNRLLTINNSTFDGNGVVANGSGEIIGGAIYVSKAASSSSENAPKLTINDSSFKSNQTPATVDSKGQGGAIFARRVDCEINGSVFEDNSARYGGAFFKDSGETTINNSVFAGNSASQNGSAIEIFSRNTNPSNKATLCLYNTTVVNNISAANLGAVFVDARDGKTVIFEAYNSIIAYNAANFANNSKKDVDTSTASSGKIQTVARNVLTNYKGWTDSSCVVYEATGERDVYSWVFDSSLDSFKAENIMYTDPNAGSLLYTLKRNARAIGREYFGLGSISNGFVQSDVDLAGNARIAGGYVDMGAYEYQSASPEFASLTVVGDMLVESPLEARFDTAFTPTATYQWYKATKTNAANGSWTKISGATGSSYEPVLADAGYCLRVVATGTGSYAGQLAEAQTKVDGAFVCVTTQLAQPVASIDSCGTDYVVVSWKAISRASKYAVSYRAEGSSTWTTKAYAYNASQFTTNGSTKSYRVEGLSSDVAYEFRVQARGDNTNLMNSEYSDIVYAATVDGSILLSGVQGNGEAGQTLSAALATSDANVSYQWYGEDGDGNWVAVDGATSASYQTTSADVGKRFLVVATAAGNDGWDGADFAASETVVWTQLPAPAARIDSVGDDLIVVSWDFVENAQGYVVAIREANDNFWTVSPELDAGENACTIENLDTNVEYELKVLALGDGTVYTTSDYCDVLSATTGLAALAAPVITSTSSTGDSITIRWDAEGLGSGFEVAYAPEGSADFTTVTVASSSTSYTLSGLSDGETYSFKVRELGVVNQYSDSAWSAIATETTDASNPSLKFNVYSKTVTAITDKNVVLTRGVVATNLTNPTYTVYIDGVKSTKITVNKTWGQIVYSGGNNGLPARSEPYVVTVTASAGGKSASADFLLTVVNDSKISTTVSTNSPKYNTGVRATVKPTGSAVTYQWYRTKNATPATAVWTAIDGATKATYVPTTADLGYYLKVMVRGTGANDGHVTQAITSGKVTRPILSVTLPTTVEYNKTITAFPSPSSATATYQWYRGSNEEGWTAIKNATGLKYVPQLADVGKFLKVTVTGKDNFTGTVSKVTGKRVTASLISVTVAGNLKVGSKITSYLSPSSATVTYQWYSSKNGSTWTAISGATDKTYTPTDADAGKYLRVSVKGTGYFKGTVIKTTSGKIAAASSTASAQDAFIGYEDAVLDDEFDEFWETLEETLVK